MYANVLIIISKLMISKLDVPNVLTNAQTVSKLPKIALLVLIKTDH